MQDVCRVYFANWHDFCLCGIHIFPRVPSPYKVYRTWIDTKAPGECRDETATWVEQLPFNLAHLVLDKS